MSKAVILFGLFTLFCACSPKQHTVEGVIAEVSVTDHRDVLLKLADNDTLYYVNRGDEEALAERLKPFVHEKEVTLQVEALQTPFGTGYAIQQIHYGDSCLYKQ